MCSKLEYVGGTGMQKKALVSVDLTVSVWLCEVCTGSDYVGVVWVVQL